MTAVHQFVPSYVGRTAIGTHTHEVRRMLLEMGVRSHVYVGEARDVPDREVYPFQQYAPRPGEPTWLLYQLSTGHGMADMLAGATQPLLVNYHNITPERFIEPWEPLVAPELRTGREQLRRLAGRASLAIAVSRYNEAELIEASYQRTATVPVLVDLARLGSQPDVTTAARLARAKGGGGTDWLFVGRLAPNKAQHRLIQALAVYRRLYDRRARLWLVGGSSSHRYQTALERLAAALDLGDAVTLTGSVSQPVLAAHYQAADVFLCLSEHEGFGIPLVEAMWHGVPVVALASSGVTDTVGDAGLVLRRARPRRPGGVGRRGEEPGAAEAAAAVARVLTDGALREALVARGRQRAATFDLPATRQRMRTALAAVIDS